MSKSYKANLVMPSLARSSATVEPTEPHPIMWHLPRTFMGLKYSILFVKSISIISSAKSGISIVVVIVIVRSIVGAVRLTLAI